MAPVGPAALPEPGHPGRSRGGGETSAGPEAPVGRRRWGRRTGVLLCLAAVLWLVGGGSQAAIAAPTPAAQTTTDVYHGTMTIAIDYRSLCGGSYGIGTYQLPVTVTIAPPESFVNEFGFRVVEDNPHSLHIQAGTASDEGALTLDSAAIIGPGQLTNRAIFKYWSLARNGQALSGQLVEDHAEESVAYNLLNASRELVACRPEFGFLLWSEAVAEGSLLSGTITPTRADITVDGNVKGLTRPFTAHIIATRPK